MNYRKRKASDNTHYKYDMYDKRRAKRFKKKGIAPPIGAAAGAGASGYGVSRAVSGAVSSVRANAAYLPALEEALGGEIMLDLAVPAALSGALGAGAIAAGGALGYLIGNFFTSPQTNEEDDRMMDLVDAALGLPNKNKMATPYYQGSFAAPVRAKEQIEDLYMKYGAYKVKEQFGAVNGSESLYIAANPFSIDSFAYTIAMSMLRKLFRKIGKEITDFDAPLTFSNLGEAYLLTMRYENDDGQISVVTYETIQDETLITLVHNSEIVPRIGQYLLLENTNILAWIDLAVYDNYTSTTTPPIHAKLPRHLANLNLKNEKVQYYMSCNVVVQNRTKGAADGSSSSTEVVDSQPLKGYLYYFKKTTPATKMLNYSGAPYTQTWTPFERTNFQGIQLINGAQAQGSMRDLPTAKFFSNCSKSSYVKLEPGAMKKFKVENVYFKLYADLIRKARITGATNAIYPKVQNIGDTMMIGLEEILNSGSNNKITVQYEAENKTGAYFVTGPVPCMKKLYEQVLVNALDS